MKNKGFFTNAILKIYKQKENYSHIHTHAPSKLVPSYEILLKLISEMWDDPSPTLKGFKLLKKYKKLCFYQNIENPKTILVGIKDTDFSSTYDIYTIGVRTAILKGSVTKLKRYNNDIKDIIKFQKKYPTNEYYYIGTGLSVAGSISDLLLEYGYLHEAVTFNSLIDTRFMNRTDIKNYRIYLDEDICYLAFGQYACNTKVYAMNPVKKTFINPIEEFKHLYHLHTMNNKLSHSLPHLKKILKEEEENKQHIVNV
jgi:L-rhamnose mutarotase